MNMSDKTEIYHEDDDTIMYHDENETTENRETVQEASKRSKSGYILTGVGVLAGVGAGMLGYHLAWGMSENSEEPEPTPVADQTADENAAYQPGEFVLSYEAKLAQSSTGDLSYEQAFHVSREELGAGGFFIWNNELCSTYYRDEWDALSPADHDNHWGQIDINIQVGVENNELVFEPGSINMAENVADEMTFGQAFAAARQEVGEGGVFAWRGELFNTYYKEEWADMTPEIKDEFMAVVMDEFPSQFPIDIDESAIPLAHVVDIDPINDQDLYDAEGDEYADAIIPHHDDSGSSDEDILHHTPLLDVSNDLPDLPSSFEDAIEPIYLDNVPDGVENVLLPDVGDYVHVANEAANVIDIIAPDLISDNILGIMNGADDIAKIIDDDGSINISEAGNFLFDAIF